MNRYRWLVVVVVALSMIVVSSSSSSGTTTTASKGGSAQCKSVPLKATEVGVTPSDISIQVMADVGSPLAPGLFQANVDAINGFAKYWNAHGGIGCRQVKVNVWDSKLSAEESKNGLINGCQNSLAKVGGSTLFNADVSPMTGCVDKSGAATGLPDLAGVANSLTEQCAKGVYVIHSVNEVCPVVLGRPRPFREPGGTTKWYVKNLFKGVKPHGLYMVPGDLPSTTASSMPIIESQRQAGFTFDDLLKVSSRDTQAAFTPRVQSVKDHASNFVFGGTNDTGLILMRKEAKAQGVDTVKLWACSLGCYTKAFVASGGTAVDGTYLWLGFLPFEEVKANKEMQHYVTTVGTDKINSFGGEAWMAGVLFKQAIDDVVASHGPNGITRVNLLAALDKVKDFTANGWLGKKDLHGHSPCFLILQLRNAKWVRVYPKKVGTMDCTASNVTTVTVDPAVEVAKIK